MTQGGISNPPISTDKNTVDLAERAKRASKRRAEMAASGDLQIRNPIEKARDKPKSRKLAMDAACYSCQGGSLHQRPDSGWQWAIGNCTVDTCPLHPHRPYQYKHGKPPEGVYR